MKKIVVETSARHVHLSEADLKILLGEGNELTVKKMLSQPGQYASNERIDLVGPKNTIKNVLILGPVRKATQVEISLTDARALGVNALIRESGDIAGTSGIKLVGPAGEVEITEGVIAAKRHVHLDTATANEMGLSDKQIVSVKVEGERGLTFGEVVVRVNDNFAPAVHLDTDEANAAALSGEVYGEIIA
ncbi:MAG: phosphate propanoyltransferase [Clostridia bacterium]|nr:phosphate propanoyltransferase [Clostridia bacterium]MBQ3155051.1 phosphate propanoyltransferase [Clostridia bacterium]